MTDHRRAWINLAEAIRVLRFLPWNGKPWDPARDDAVADRIQELPLDQTGQEIVHVAFYGGLADGLGVDGAAERVAAFLSGQPCFDVPRFMRHATSDSPDDSNAYNRENPEEAMKIDIEAG